MGIDAALARSGCSFHRICVFGVFLGVRAGTWGDGHGKSCSPASSGNLGQGRPQIITEPCSVSGRDQV